MGRETADGGNGAAGGHGGDPACMGGRFDVQPGRGKEAAAATALLSEGGTGSAKAG